MDKWYNSYRWWWAKWPGRPWTYWIRDARRDNPTAWMLCVMVVSATIGHYLWSWWLLAAFIGLLAGILWGHLWWGSRDTPGQGIDDSIMAPGEHLSDYQEDRR